MKNKYILPILTILIASSGLTFAIANEVKAPMPPSVPSAPSAPAMAIPKATAPKAVTLPSVTKPVAAKPVPTPSPAPAVAPNSPAMNSANEATTLGELNKQHLLSFIQAARANDVGSFYRANPQFAQSMTEQQFVSKFGKYSQLPDDIAQLRVQNFSDTKVSNIANKKYKGCRMVEARSHIKLQVVQDSHEYDLTNRYCHMNGDYKLVSFKLFYLE